jgi:ABC-type thiamin/hydroxymethylpyrimidine transport system permease subunit
MITPTLKPTNFTRIISGASNMTAVVPMTNITKRGIAITSDITARNQKG